jgi:hypothetical protein
MPTASAIQDAKNNTDLLLKVLDGTWSGTISKPTSWRPGLGNNRVLILHSFDKELIGYYGVRIETVKRVTINVEIINGSISISFLTPANLRVNLRLMRDGWLQGTLSFPDSPAVHLSFIKDKK